jgi:hypothetical protein
VSGGEASRRELTAGGCQNAFEAKGVKGWVREDSRTAGSGPNAEVRLL